MCVCVCVCSGRVAPRPPAMRPLTSEREAVSCVSWFGHCCGSRPGRLPASSGGGPAGERCFPARPMVKTHVFIRQRAFQTQHTTSPDSLWCSSRPAELTRMHHEFGVLRCRAVWLDGVCARPWLAGAVLLALGQWLLHDQSLHLGCGGFLF